MAADLVTATVLIDADPADVYEYFTRTEAMLEWMGEYARLDARPGGEFAIDIRGQPIRGRYVELEFPRRVVFTWGVAGSEELPAGSTTVEVSLAEESGGTRVELLHRGLPEHERPKHEHGWTYFLGRLAVVPATR